MNNCILCESPCHGSICEDCSLDLEWVDDAVINRFIHTTASKNLEGKKPIILEEVNELQQRPRCLHNE